jgi:hypothetical protein
MELEDTGHAKPGECGLWTVHLRVWGYQFGYREHWKIRTPVTVTTSRITGVCGRDRTARSCGLSTLSDLKTLSPHI